MPLINSTRALLRGALKGAMVVAILAAIYLLTWFVLISTCVTSGNECGGDAMTAGVRIMLAPFF